jgi:coproporphyrinogen III oxidase
MEALKREVLGYYSGGTPACRNPFSQHAAPYYDLRALSIDHVLSGGTKHRKNLRGIGGHHFYRWLKKKGFPPGYQVLCMNCQFIKRDTANEMRRK